MELAELIDAVKAAKTKDALEALVKAELAIDLDKRKTLKALRAETLKGLGVTVDEGDDTDDTEPPADEAPAQIAPPALDEAPAPAIEPATGNRLLRHKATGRTFVWAPVLAALADLEEV